MKALIILVVGLLSVGCLTPEQKALRDSIVGEYERKKDGTTYKLVLLEDGIVLSYHNSKKYDEGNWSISNGQIHFMDEDGDIGVCRINKDKSLSTIAIIFDGKRTDLPKKEQDTFKKIK